MVIDKMGDSWCGYWCADDESTAMVIERDGERWSVSVYKYLAQYAYIKDRAAISTRDGTLSVSLDMSDQGRAYTLRWDVPGERLVSAYEMPYELAVSSGWDAIMLGLPDDHAWAEPPTTYRRATDAERQAIAARRAAWRKRRRAT